MPPAKWKCSEPGCGVSAKNEAGLIEHYEEFHFEKDYPGLLKTTKASKSSKNGSAAKTTTSRTPGTSNDNSDSPVVSRAARAKSGKKTLAAADDSDEEVKDEDGDYQMDFDGDYTPTNGIDVEMSNGSVGDMSIKAASKRKATGSPSKLAPPPKKPTAHASGPMATPKDILARLQGFKTSTPRTPVVRKGARAARKGGDDDTPEPTPRTLGARAIARLTEKASNDPSRDLQPIRRPLPPRFQEWSDGEGSDFGAHDSSSDDEPSAAAPRPLTALQALQLDPTFNQDLSDSDASEGISEDENGDPRPYDPNAPGPDPLNPFSTSAKYRVLPPRGIVKNKDGSTIDFDACMTFPDIPDPAVLNKKATNKMKDISDSLDPAPQKVVMMSFSDNTATPSINWTVRRAADSKTSHNLSGAFGEPLTLPDHPSGISLSITGDSIMIAYIEAKNREKLKAKEAKDKKARALKMGKDAKGLKKKKASRQPKYEKRKYTWKDSTRKNKGRLYDSRKKEQGEAGADGDEDGDGEDDE